MCAPARRFVCRSETSDKPTIGATLVVAPPPVVVANMGRHRGVSLRVDWGRQGGLPLRLVRVNWADTEVYPYRIGLKRGEGFTCGGVCHTLP